MKFLCDVHIPFKLVRWLISEGFEAIHVNSILDSWNTVDSKIRKFTDDNDFILITKDKDFKSSFFIIQSPKKLIRVTMGNIQNYELINLFSHHKQLIISLSKHDRFFLEIGKSYPLFHYFD